MPITVPVLSLVRAALATRRMTGCYYPPSLPKGEREEQYGRERLPGWKRKLKLLR